MPAVKQVESGKLLCLETIGSLQNVAEFFKQIDKFVKERKVSVKGDRLVILYEDPAAVDREQAHYAATVELAGECTGDGEVTVVIQGAMTVAYENHQGPYEGLQEVYQKLISWIHERGYKISGYPREFYLVGPPLEPAAYITEIQIPVEKLSGGESRGT